MMTLMVIFAILVMSSMLSYYMVMSEEDRNDLRKNKWQLTIFLVGAPFVFLSVTIKSIIHILLGRKL